MTSRSSSTSTPTANAANYASPVTAATWHRFFTQFTGITSAVGLALALVFFIAYNWLYMGKMAKFSLVETALIVSIVAYCVLVYKGLYKLGQQLLLLIASLITGSLLALVGQVYQTGADSWQLFFGWAALIVPWVFIARLPALWLLWLGLINLSFMLYHSANPFGFSSAIYSEVMYMATLSAINVVALILGLKFYDKADSELANPPLHWSLYWVGLLVVITTTRLGLLPTLQPLNKLDTGLSLGLWLVIMMFFYGYFRKQRIDLLMLTLFCGSVIIVTMGLFIEYLKPDNKMLIWFFLAFILIIMSASAVNWLQKLATLPKAVKPQSQFFDLKVANNELATTNKPLIAQQDPADSTDASSTTYYHTANDNTVKRLLSLNQQSLDSQSQSKPWYIQLFLGLSGLLSGTFITFFLYMLTEGVLRSPIVHLILSISLLCISFLLFNPRLHQATTDSSETNTPFEVNKSNTFRNSVALALSIATQILLVTVLLDWFDSFTVVTTIFMLVQLLLLALIRDPLSRFFSAFMALICLTWLLSKFQLHELSIALLALIATATGLPSSMFRNRFNRTKNSNYQALLKPINYASTTLLLLASAVLIRAEHRHDFPEVDSVGFYNYPLAQGLLILVCLYAAQLILSNYQLKLRSKTGLYIALAIICLGLVSIYVSGILATSLVIIMAVANQKRLLLGLGITALVGYIYIYYYQLDSSLLIKSLSLLAVAMVLFAIHKLISSPRFAQSAQSQPYSPAQSESTDEELS